MKLPLTMIAAIMASEPALSAPAQQSGAPSFLGRWKLDTGSASASGNAGPANVIAEFTDGGDGIVKTTYVITEEDGRARRMTSQERLDGTAVPIAGDQTIYDSAAMTSPVPGVLVMGLGKGGNLSSVRTYTVPVGGNEMIESATVVGEDGKPTIHRFRWVR